MSAILKSAWQTKAAEPQPHCFVTSPVSGELALAAAPLAAGLITDVFILEPGRRLAAYG
jgi:hypothetical protein